MPGLVLDASCTFCLTASPSATGGTLDTILLASSSSPSCTGVRELVWRGFLRLNPSVIGKHFSLALTLLSCWQLHVSGRRVSGHQAH
jgi:hypothetical protein